jgi:hypothetical protein
MWPGAVVVRDSKDPDGPVLRFTTREWEVFLLGVHNGEFELPPSLAAASYGGWSPVFLSLFPVHLDVRRRKEACGYGTESTQVKVGAVVQLPEGSLI